MFVHSHAPVRIGLAGGGTDLPAWTREKIGYCLSLAISTYAHAVAIERSDGQAIALYSGHIDRAACATEFANALVRESALLHGFETNFEICTMSEISSKGSGLGVSSSFAVALAACFSRMGALRVQRGLGASSMAVVNEDRHRARIAKDAWTVEIERLRRPVGRQDHMAAAYGGLRLYAFEGNEARVDRTFKEDDAKWAASHLCLLRLPEGHDARAILSGVKNPSQVQGALEAVDVAVQAIDKHDAKLLGQALWMGQSSKRLIAGAVTESIDALVDKILAVSGVWGCKVAGAGGGGHLIVCCEPEAVAGVSAVAGIEAMTVKPDFGGVKSEGSV